MKKFLFLPAILTGCTISIIQTDTHGAAEDIVDNTSSQRVEPETNLSVPLTGK